MSVSVFPKLRLTVPTIAWDLAGVAAPMLLTVDCCCVHCSVGLQVSRLGVAGCSIATVALLRPPVVGNVAGCHCSRCSRRCSCRGSSVLPWAPLSVLVVAERCGGCSVNALRRRVGRSRIGVGLSRTLLAVKRVRWHAVPAGVDAKRGWSVCRGSG